MDRGGEIELLQHLMEPNGFLLVTVLCEQDRTADEIAHQRQKPAADQCLSNHRVAGQIDVGKAV